MSGPDREARVARVRGSRVADFARGRGSRGAGRRPPATLPTLSESGPIRWLGSAPDAGGAGPAPPAPPFSSRRETVPAIGAVAELAHLVVLQKALNLSLTQADGGRSAADATAAPVQLCRRRDAAAVSRGRRTMTAPWWDCRAPRWSASHVRAPTIRNPCERYVLTPTER